MTWIIVAAGIILLFFAICYYSYRKAFYSPKKGRDVPIELSNNPYRKEADAAISLLVKEMEELTFEDVWIKSFDGKKLYGRYYHVMDNAPLEIQFHGYRGTAFRDFGGGNKLARGLGHNTLLIDQRAHGKSEGSTITFGVRERLDCKSWVDYAVKRFGEDQKIILSGISMGAATVLMASDLNLPKNVKGIIADCPYSCPKEIIKKVCREDMKMPRGSEVFAYLGGFIFGKGLKLSKSSALKSVASTNIPILIIHGEADGFVPCKMSEDIYSKAPDNVRLETFPNAGHGYSFIVDDERYKKVIVEFDNLILKD